MQDILLKRRQYPSPFHNFWWRRAWRHRARSIKGRPDDPQITACNLDFMTDWPICIYLTALSLRAAVTNCYCCQMWLLKCSKPNRKIRYFHLFYLGALQRANKSAIIGHGKALIAAVCHCRDSTTQHNTPLPKKCRSQPQTPSKVLPFQTKWRQKTGSTQEFRETNALHKFMCLLHVHASIKYLI